MISWSNILHRKRNQKDSFEFSCWKVTLKVQILQSLRRLFIIIVGLTMTWFSEKMLISNICICIRGLMPNLIKNDLPYIIISNRFIVELNINNDIYIRILFRNNPIQDNLSFFSSWILIVSYTCLRPFWLFRAEFHFISKIIRIFCKS